MGSLHAPTLPNLAKIDGMYEESEHPKYRNPTPKPNDRCTTCTKSLISMP